MPSARPSFRIGPTVRRSASPAAPVAPRGASLWRTPMSTVADVMTTKVIAVREDATLAEAQMYLATQHISGAAVTDHRRRLVGVVTRSDIMEAEAEVEDQDVRGRFLDDTLVRDVMTTPALTIGPEAEL